MVRRTRFWLRDSSCGSAHERQAASIPMLSRLLIQSQTLHCCLQALLFASTDCGNAVDLQVQVRSATQLPEAARMTLHVAM